MLRTLVFGMVTVTFAAPSLVAQESPATASALLRRCETALRLDSSSSGHGTKGEMIETGMCVGQVRGVADTMILWAHDTANVTGDAHLPVCLPKILRPRTGIQIVVSYLKKHPEKSAAPDSVMIYLALLDAFPCEYPSDNQPSSQPEDESTNQPPSAPKQ